MADIEVVSEKLFKIVVTRCIFIFTAKCTKFDFVCGSALDPAAGAYSCLSPDPLAGFTGLTTKGKEGEGGEWNWMAYPLFSI